MEIIKLRAHIVGASANIWWEDAEGFRYRMPLAFDRALGGIITPLAVGLSKKGRYSDGVSGPWIAKLGPVSSTLKSAGTGYISSLDATSKRWAPIVADVLRQVAEGDLIEKARAKQIADEAAREEAEAAKREAQIREGLTTLYDASHSGPFMEALGQIIDHATRDDLFKLAGAVR